MTDEHEKKLDNSKAWWPNVSYPERALESAKATQFIAYWIGGSYLVMGYLGSSSVDIIVGITIGILGLAIWKNFFWAVPIAATIGVLEAGTKIALLFSVGRFTGFIIAAVVLFYSFHGFRAWLALRKQSRDT